MGLARRTDFYTALCPPGGVATQTPSPWIGTSPFSVPYSTATLGEWNWGAWPSGAASQPSTAKNAPSGRSTSAADLDFGSLGRHFRLAGLGFERQIAAGDVLLDEPEELRRFHHCRCESKLPHSSASVNFDPVNFHHCCQSSVDVGGAARSCLLSERE